MTIVKKLFLMTILGLGINIQLRASEHQSDTELLNFANNLDRMPTESSEPKNIASWIRKTFYGADTRSKNITNQLKGIVESTDNPTQRAQAIKQIYAQETTPQQSNEGYFSNISARMKAAALFVIGASIASYFYFMYPWSTPATQQ